MLSFIDSFKKLPSEIRCNVLAHLFDDNFQGNKQVPPILIAFRGETQLYFEALAEYYALTTLIFTEGSFRSFLDLSRATKELVRNMSLDIRLHDLIYNPQGTQADLAMEMLEGVSKVHNLEQFHLIPRLCMYPDSHSQSPYSPHGPPQSADTSVTDLISYLYVLSQDESLNLKQIEKRVREVLSDFYETKLMIVQKILSAFPSLRRLVVEPRLEDFVYSLDSFVGAVNDWLGLGKLMKDGTGRRGEGQQWMWDLRGRRRIVIYEESMRLDAIKGKASVIMNTVSF